MRKNGEATRASMLAIFLSAGLVPMVESPTPIITK